MKGIAKKVGEGHSEFGSDSGLEDGEIWYFSYADKDHCATWNSLDGWN